MNGCGAEVYCLEKYGKDDKQIFGCVGEKWIVSWCGIKVGNKITSKVIYEFCSFFSPVNEQDPIYSPIILFIFKMSLFKGRENCRFFNFTFFNVSFWEGKLL